KHVANNIAVTLTGLALGGAQATDYTIAPPSLSANIIPAPLTVTGITASNKVYDAGPSATLNKAGAGVSGVLSGDAVTLNTSATVGAFAGRNAGTNVP